MPGFVPYDLAFNSTPTADIVRRSDGGPTELVFKVPGGGWSGNQMPATYYRTPRLARQASAERVNSQRLIS